MTKNEYLDFLKTISGAVTDQPFNRDFETYAARHSDSKKWFALLMEHDGKTIVNLKCEPLESDILRQHYKSLTPAYHMNKTHWNTVVLDGDVPVDEIKRLTYLSFDLTK